MVKCNWARLSFCRIFQVFTLSTLVRPGRSLWWLRGSLLRLRTLRTSLCSLLGPMARGLSSSLRSTLVLMPLLVGTHLVHSQTRCKHHSVSHACLSWLIPGLIIRYKFLFVYEFLFIYSNEDLCWLFCSTVYSPLRRPHLETFPPLPSVILTLQCVMLILAFLPTTRESRALVAYFGCLLGWFCRCVVQFSQGTSGISWLASMIQSSILQNIIFIMLLIQYFIFLITTACCSSFVGWSVLLQGPRGSKGAWGGRGSGSSGLWCSCRICCPHGWYLGWWMARSCSSTCSRCGRSWCWLDWCCRFDFFHFVLVVY